jgi:transglutaminase-like putative cysteine protease
MDFRYKPAIRIISSIVLCFFCWTFCICEIPNALANSQQSGNSNQQSAISSQSAQPKPLKSEERFQKAIDDITQIVSDTSTDTDTKKNKLKTKRSEIEGLDTAIKKQFSDTERFLKEKGLPPEILERHHKFVKHYEDNLKELNDNLDAIDKSKTKSETDASISRAKSHLEKVKAPSKHVPLDPNKLPFTSPEIKTFERIEKRSTEEPKSDDSLKKNAGFRKNKSPILIASAGSLAGLLAQASDDPTIIRNSPPTEADLAETLEIKFTPELQAKVAEIGTSPVKLYEYVRNHFTYEPYYGSLKGSQHTLLEMAGDDIDLASVLIALLRSANVPSRYVCGTIELSTDDLMNWLGGIKDPNTAAQIMATNGIPGTLLTEGGTIKYAQFDHCWVEAYVDMFPSMGSINKQGKYWTPIDPSMKEMEISESIDISKTLSFDETTYLNSADNMPPALSYLYKLMDYYEANYDQDIKKIFHIAFTKRQEFGILLGTLPFKVISEQRYSEIPDAKRHKIRLGLSSTGIYDTGPVYTIEKMLPEIAGKKLTISYAPATPNDQTVINNYGGLLNTPTYLINVKPEIRLNDALILTGPIVGLGAQMTLTTTLSSPNISTDIKTTDITYGISYAIGIPTLDYPGTQLGGQIDILRNLQGAFYDSINAMDTRAGELLQHIAIAYFRQIALDSKTIESIMHVYVTKMPSIALVSADAAFNEIFGIPISPPIMQGFGIDAIRVASSPVSLDGDMNKRREFIKHRGLDSSYLEHKILENLLSVESISAVKALQIAYKNGIPIYTLNESNVDSILPILTISNDDKADIRNAVNAGKEVMVSRDNIALYDWTGVGYIVRDPNTGKGAYMISSSLGGGGTVKASNPAFDKEQKMAYFIAGQQQHWYEFLAWPYVEDTVLEIFAMPLWSYFGYTPDFIIEVTNKELVINAANNKNTWIFYYSGHGGYREEEPLTDFLSPKEGDNETVFPTGIRTDTKIVFLNGCGAGHYGDFISSFGIDQQHKVGDDELHRDEVFISWTKSVSAFFAADFGLNFWRLMGSSKTSSISASQAIELLKNRYALIPAYFLDLESIKRDGDATLVP